MTLCADVLIESLPASVGRDIFTYSIPSQFRENICPGTEVAVPFGSQTRLGYVIDLHQHPPAESLRGILRITGQQRLDREYLSWLKWVADYYLASLSQVIGIAVPRKLSGKVRNVIRPLAEPAHFLRTVEQAFGQSSRLYEFAVYLIATAPQWKSRQSCLRQFGRRSQEYLQLLQKHLLIEVYTEVQQPAEAKEQLMVTLLEDPGDLSPRQRELWQQLRAEGGQVLLSAFCQQHHTTPVTLRRLESQGAVSIAPQRIQRRPLDEARESKPLQTLTSAQAEVFARIRTELETPSQRPILLHGVTGSGKTEVYLHALATVLARGDGGLFLVPEIALTPQMLRRCRAVFGDAVAVLHSELSDGEYRDEWDRIRDGVARIVVGARSAIFAPIPRLKLIVVDEEHESTYKQDSHLRYDARLLARMRMRLNGGVVIFGSATPRLESFEQVQRGRWLHLKLPERIHRQPLPPIYLVDMRQEQARGNFGVFSQALKRAMDETLARQEQAILLLNRRGYTGSWLCRDCGEALRCELCAVSLTYHRSDNRLKCHYCDFSTHVPRQCPICRSDKIQGFGIGTQKLEEITQRLFPTARILRMDRDSTSLKNAHTRILDAFGQGDADILIGTQMVAKGLDFPKVTLVGLLAADMALNLPDFRAGERTFQLLTQAAGRAGRSELPGRIFLQTYAPEHPAIRHALRHDYEGFFAEERIEREMLGYPPFGELARLLFAHPREAIAHEVAQRFAQELKAHCDARLLILGPVAAPIARIQALFRVHMLLKHPRLSELKPLLRQLNQKYRHEVQRLVLDIDPYSML